ncbi:MAG: hypothetical protein JST17_04985 [Bacteroidetes bacterium]|nr:hypothetical protein [Bacteroidota bacterium]MBS1932051.1 hypothetical protein [Bacteroidota bacterium]
MKTFLTLLFFCFTIIGYTQTNTPKPEKWRIDKNKWITGGLVFTAGAAKGFNETLLFHFSDFQKAFPNINAQWFDPKISWANKYKDGDSRAGAKFPLSTTMLVMVTDQYHLNNFIWKLALTSALVIKIGAKKQPFRYYIYDMLYYTFCHQAGFLLTYMPFAKKHTY